MKQERGNKLCPQRLQDAAAWSQVGSEGEPGDIKSRLIRCTRFAWATTVSRRRHHSLKTLPWYSSSDRTWHLGQHKHHSTHTHREREKIHTQQKLRMLKSSKLNLVIGKCGYLSKLRWGAAFRLCSLLTSSRYPPGGTHSRSLARSRVPAATCSRKVAVRVSLGPGSPTASHLDEGQSVKPATPHHTIFHTSFRHHSSDATTSVALGRGAPLHCFFLTDPIGVVDSFHSFFPSILNADSYNIKKHRIWQGHDP